MPMWEESVRLVHYIVHDYIVGRSPGDYTKEYSGTSEQRTLCREDVFLSEVGNVWPPYGTAYIVGDMKRVLCRVVVPFSVVPLCRDVII